jgi:hypothetical protein
MAEYARYPTLHWLLTIIAAPVLIITYVHSSFTPAPVTNVGDLLEMYWLTFVFGALLSVPSYVLYLVVFFLLFERIRSSLLLKGLCNVFVICCAGITYWLFNGSAMPMLFLMYVMAVVYSSALLKIRPQAKPL